MSSSDADVYSRHKVRVEELPFKGLKSSDINSHQKLILIYATVTVHSINHGKLLYN